MGKATITLQDNGEWATEVEYVPGQEFAASIVARGEDGKPVVAFFDNEEDFMKAGGHVTPRYEPFSEQAVPANPVQREDHCREVVDLLSYSTSSVSGVFRCHFAEYYYYDGVVVWLASYSPVLYGASSPYSLLSGSSFPAHRQSIGS